MARIAAPVGVVSSHGTDDSAKGIFRNSSAVAGAGMLHSPWAMRTRPVPVATGEATIRSAPNRSQPTAAPTMSAIESAAPTSWKWTFPTVVPWTLASASARQVKIRRARSFCRSVNPLPSIIPTMWCRWRWACSGSYWTVTCVARNPCFLTSWATSRQPGSPSDPTAVFSASRSTPASTRAPSVMSPLMPLAQSR